MVMMVLVMVVMMVLVMVVMMGMMTSNPQAMTRGGLHSLEPLAVESELREVQLRIIITIIIITITITRCS